MGGGRLALWLWLARLRGAGHARAALRLAAIIVGLAGSALSSCGDDDAGGGSTVETGLPADQKLSELDGEDVKTACEHTADDFEGLLSPKERKRIACVGGAVELSITMSGDTIRGDIDKCKTLAEQCEKDGTIGGVPVDPVTIERVDCRVEEPDAALATCDATVGEFEKCLGAMLDALRAQLSRLTCDGLKDLEQLQQDAMGGLDASTLPACKLLVDECPDIELPGSEPIDGLPGDDA